jgi:hypothetical protein
MRNILPRWFYQLFRITRQKGIEAKFGMTFVTRMLAHTLREFKSIPQRPHVIIQQYCTGQ